VDPSILCSELERQESKIARRCTVRPLSTGILSRITSKIDRASERRFVADIPLPVAGAAVVLASVVIRHLFLHAFHLIHFSAIAIAALLILPAVVARLSDEPDFAAKLFAWRSSVMTTLLVANLVLAALIAWVYRPWHYGAFTAEMVVAFFVQGILVGGFVRLLLVKYIEKALNGMSTEAVEVMLLGLVSVYLWLFPTSQQHSMLALPYLVGIAAGFVAHFLLRSRAHQHAKEIRMRQNLMALLRGSDGPILQQRVALAVDLYAQGKLHELKRHLEAQTGKMSTPLVIVQVSMKRVEENSEREALQLVNDELEKCNPKDELYTYLLLLKAFCLGDLSSDHKEMLSTLDFALKRNPKCALAKSAWGLRTSEDVPLENRDAPSQRRLKRAFLQVRQAVALAQQEFPGVWGRVAGISVPFNWTFLLDAYAYVALRNGDMRISKVFLEYCIRSDSKCASPYLHLGEWYLVMARKPEVDDAKATRDKKIARLCFKVAEELEGKRNTITKRRAQELLAKYLSK
jgi:hypothetical protein